MSDWSQWEFKGGGMKVLGDKHEESREHWRGKTLYTYIQFLRKNIFKKYGPLQCIQSKDHRHISTYKCICMNTWMQICMKTCTIYTIKIQTTGKILATQMEKVQHTKLQQTHKFLR